MILRPRRSQTMKCVWCGTKEVKSQKWKVCTECYGWLRKNTIIDTSPGQYSLDKRSFDKRVAKIVARFGEGIKESMSELMKGDGSVTLKSVGEQYKVTREYVRQLFKLFHGESYSSVARRRSELNKQMKIEAASMSCSNDPRNKVASCKNHDSSIFKGAESELIVFNKCRELGMDVYPSKNKEIDLIINGWKCDVKSRSTTMKQCSRGKRIYYNCNMSIKQREICDFIIFHLVTTNEFYIFPREYISKKGLSLFIPASPSAYKHKNCKNTMDTNIHQYKEAWHLLENSNHVPCGYTK